MNSTDHDQDSPPRTLCWECQHGAVVVESVAGDVDDDVLPRRTQVETSFCRHPFVAGKGDPIPMEDPVIDCQAFQAQMSVQGETESSGGEPGERVRREALEAGREGQGTD